MRIKTIESQIRRDFYAIFECEHCNYEKRGRGYDDDNFHRNVIPAMTCEKCGKTAAEDHRPIETRYAEHEVI